MIFTSFHQSPLPTALVLRMAGVPRIAAISEDYPGSLLDVRHRLDDDIPRRSGTSSWPGRRASRCQRGRGPAGGDGRVAGSVALGSAARYVVVHAQRLGTGPGAVGGPGRRPWSSALAAAGHRVLVTGSDGRRRGHRGRLRAGARAAVDLGGRTSLPMLAAVLAGADVVVAPNTGAAHLAAAVGTPGGEPVRAGRAGRPLGAVRGADRLLGRPGRGLRGQPGPGLPGPRPPVPGPDRPGRGGGGGRRAGSGQADGPPGHRPEVAR